MYSSVCSCMAVGCEFKLQGRCQVLRKLASRHLLHEKSAQTSVCRPFTDSAAGAPLASAPLPLIMTSCGEQHLLSTPSSGPNHHRRLNPISPSVPVRRSRCLRPARVARPGRADMADRGASGAREGGRVRARAPGGPGCGRSEEGKRMIYNTELRGVACFLRIHPCYRVSSYLFLPPHLTTFVPLLLSHTWSLSPLASSPPPSSPRARSLARSRRGTSSGRLHTECQSAWGFHS